MKKRLVEYIIPYKGLKEGIHTFEFRVDSAFIEYFSDTDIQDADVLVKVQLDNKSTFLHFSFQVRGNITVLCDRCLENCERRIETEDVLIVKWSASEHAKDINMMVVSEDQTEIDLSPIIYEQIKLSVPIRNVHEKETDCDQYTLQKLNKLKSGESEQKDPRWEKLKTLLNN